MFETTACPCRLYDPQHPQTPAHTVLNWNGLPNVVQSVGIPTRLRPGESVTLHGLTLAPMDDPVRLTFEASDDLRITWRGAQAEPTGAVLLPDARRATAWEATYSLGSISVSRPRQMHLRLSFERLMLRQWCVSGMMALAGVAGIVFLASLVMLLAVGGGWAMCGALVGALGAALFNPPVVRLLCRRLGFALPTNREPLGSMALPPIQIEPVVRCSESAAHPLITEYCAQLAHEASRLHILGLAAPINLDEGYVPIMLQLRRGAGADLALLQQSYSQVDELIRTDLSLKWVLGEELLDPEEAWQRHTRLTIIGEVGSGKTTILQRLSIKLGRGPVLWTVAVPVFIELHRLARRTGLEERPLDVLKDAVVETIAGAGADEARTDDLRRLVERLIETGELTLLLDGLDEVSGPGEEGERLLNGVLSAIGEAAEKWPQVRIVVTCRRASMDRYRRLPDAFVVAETMPFDAEGIAHFARHYFAAAPERAARLLDEVERNPRIRGMATTPLLLALLTLIFEQRGSLPQRRTEVYRRCAGLLLHEWDTSRERKRFPRFLLEHKEELLRRVAWELHTEGIRYVPYDRLIAQLESFLPNVGLQPEAAADVLREITAHHGLIRAYDTDWYGFVHFALQEYFAAECVEQRTPLATAISQRHRAWWQEIIRLYAGRGDCTNLIIALMREPEDLFRTNLRLAGECLAQGTAAEPGLRSDVLSELYRTARTMRIPELDAEVWQVLAQAGGEEFAPRLWEAIADETLSVKVRTAIVRHMPGAATESSRAAALALLSDEAVSPTVRSALAEVLCSGESYEELVRIVADPGVAKEVRAALAGALGKVGNEKLIPQLQELALHPATPTEVRRQVAVSLRQLGTTGTTRRILAMLGDWHTEPPTRSSLAAVVGELGEEAASPEIIRALSDPHLPSAVRTALAVSLKSLKSPAVADALLFLLKDQTTDYGVRLAIADTLCSIASDAHRSALRTLYGDRRVEEPIRVRLAVALGALGEVDVMPLLVRILGDRSARPYLRLEAARTLGMSADREIGKEMIGVLDSRSIDPLGQELAVLVLGIRNEPETALPLLDRLSDRRLPLSARLRMADTLATLGCGDQVDRLVSLLPDRSLAVEMRGRLALTIMRLTDARDTRTFERILQLLPRTDEVPEMMTLAWHLSEQVGVAVYPADVSAPEIVYPWVERWTRRRKDADGDVETIAE